MFPHENLFVGDLGKTEQPLASRFMTTPVTREVSVGDISYPMNVSLPPTDEVLATPLNGMLMLAGDNDYCDLLWFGFNQTTGQLYFQGATYWERDYTIFGETVPETPVARGIDWILTQVAIYRVLPDGGFKRKGIIHESASYFLGSDYYFLVTPHRNRGFSKGIPGGEYNPFTGTPSDGYLPYGESGVQFEAVHRVTGHSGEPFASWPSTVARVGENILIDGFVVETMDDISHYETDGMKMYSTRYHRIRPVTPIEFHEGGIPVYAMDYRVASAKDRLYARGMLTMGEACLIPAAFGEAGYPTEYFLYIANSHGYRSPYEPFEDRVLERDVRWENTSPMLLRDINNPEQNFLAGYEIPNVDPVESRGFFRQANPNGILLPDGQWHRVGQDMYYSPTSRMGLILDEQGAFFFGGDIANKTIGTLDDYKCATMADWLAPGGEIESFSQKHVTSLFRNGTLATNIERDFARYCLKDVRLGLTWGVFEKKQDAEDPDKVTGQVRLSLAIGARNKDIVVREIGMPNDVDSVPFEEIPVDNVIKNPFRLKVLKLQLGGGDYHIEGTYFEGWRSVSDDCVLYKVDPYTGNAVYGNINPETGEITESNTPGGIPAGWEAGGDGKVFGLKPHGAVYPFPSVGRYANFAPIAQPHLEGDSFTVSNGSNGMIQLVESSSGMRIAWRHSAFGEIVVNSGSEKWHDRGLTEFLRDSGLHDGHLTSLREWLEANRVGVILENAPISDTYSTMKHLGSDPVTDWRGNRKFLKTLTVWLVRMRYRQVQPDGTLGSYVGHSGNVTHYLCIMRTDLDNTVFDFDAEMEKVKN